MEEAGNYSHDHLGSIIKEGFYDRLVIIGFPYDRGARLCGKQGGQDYGPDSFRRFLVDIGSLENPEYGVSIALGLPQISDYGNIQVPSKDNMRELYEKLTQKVQLCIARGKIPFVIGGTRDLFTASA